MIEQILRMRRSLHRQLVWTKNAPIHMEIAVRGLTDTSLLFPEGHVCTIMVSTMKITRMSRGYGCPVLATPTVV